MYPFGVLQCGEGEKGKNDYLNIRDCFRFKKIQRRTDGLDVEF